MDERPRNRRQWSDAALLSAIAARDGAAFAVFYRRHVPTVLAYLIREIRDREAAADLAAEVFAAVLLAAGKYVAQSESATPWVLGIARNKLLMSLRRGRVEARARHRLGFEAVALDDGDLERIEELAPAASGTARGAGRRPAEDERVAVRSRVLDERPYREIATELQMLGDGDSQAREPRPGADARPARGDGIGMNDYLEQVEAQLAELTDRGAHRRLRARRPDWAAPAGDRAARARPAGALRPSPSCPRRRWRSRWSRSWC